MMIFKKVIPRRRFLRGVGASLALPLLDGMVPAFASTLKTPGNPVSRLSYVYVPNGIMMDKWTPATEGAGFELTPILKPLAALRDRLVVVSGLQSKPAVELPGEESAPHPRAGTAYLTGVHVLPKFQGNEGSVISGGISADQIAAKELGKYTELGSLELGIETGAVASACDSGYSCAYLNTISWRNATTPLLVENNPRTVFEHLFGSSDSTSRDERLSRTRANRGILDYVSQEVARLLAEVGPEDRAKVSQYLDAVRDVERRIQMAEKQSARELPELQRPAGIPDRFDEHLKLLFDLQVLAYQADLTRVGTLMVGCEMSNQAYPERGLPDPYHSITHHSGDPSKIAKVIEINTYHAELFSYYLTKLQSTPDGDGSLLDHTIVVYGGGISDGNMHLVTNLPILLAGGGTPQIKWGSHIRYPQDTPVTNLWMKLLDISGVAVDKLGDSNGEVDLLSL
jgi:hypothetical protein